MNGLVTWSGERREWRGVLVDASVEAYDMLSRLMWPSEGSESSQGVRLCELPCEQLVEEDFTEIMVKHRSEENPK